MKHAKRAKHFIKRGLFLMGVFGVGGLIGVLFDAFDHISCGILRGIPLWPPQNLYGCKPLHNYILLISGFFIWCAIAWLVGRLADLVRRSTGRAT